MATTGKNHNRGVAGHGATSIAKRALTRYFTATSFAPSPKPSTVISFFVVLTLEMLYAWLFPFLPSHLPSLSQAAKRHGIAEPRKSWTGADIWCKKHVHTRKPHSTRTFGRVKGGFGVLSVSGLARQR